jgi:hypothetical protein
MSEAFPITREDLLRVTTTVGAAASAAAAVEQATCLAFRGERCFAFNGDVAISAPCPGIAFEGAVGAAELNKALTAFKEPFLTGKLEGGQLVIYGAKRKRCGLTLEAEVKVNAEVENLTSATWQALDPEFANAVIQTLPASSTDANNFLLTCIHVGPGYVQAADNWQAIRSPTSVQPRDPSGWLLHRESVQVLGGLGAVEYTESQAWVHFRSGTGVVVSVRKQSGVYHNLDHLFSSEGMAPLMLPVGLRDAIELASVFTGGGDDAQIEIGLRPGMCRVFKQATTGFAEEILDVPYQGPQLKFPITPKLLLALTEKATDVFVSQRRIVAITAKYTFAVSLGAA